MKKAFKIVHHCRLGRLDAQNLAPTISPWVALLQMNSVLRGADGQGNLPLSKIG